MSTRATYMRVLGELAAAYLVVQTSGFLPLKPDSPAG